MITLTDYNGKRHYLHKDAIARVTEAGTSSQWHGIRSVVKCFDGQVIECSDTAQAIAQQIEAQAVQPQ